MRQRGAKTARRSHPRFDPAAQPAEPRALGRISRGSADAATGDRRSGSSGRMPMICSSPNCFVSCPVLSCGRNATSDDLSWITTSRVGRSSTRMCNRFAQRDGGRGLHLLGADCPRILLTIVAQGGSAPPHHQIAAFHTPRPKSAAARATLPQPAEPPQRCSPSRTSRHANGAMPVRAPPAACRQTAARHDCDHRWFATRATRRKARPASRR